MSMLSLLLYPYTIGSSRIAQPNATAIKNIANLISDGDGSGVNVTLVASKIDTIIPKNVINRKAGQSSGSVRAPMTINTAKVLVHQFFFKAGLRSSSSFRFAYFLSAIFSNSKRPVAESKYTQFFKKRHV